MDRILKKEVGLVILLLFFFGFVSGVDFVGAVSPTPSYATVSGVPDSSGTVNLYTGDMSLGIPLLTVPGRGGMSYPISIGYSAGIKQMQEAGVAGLGWSIGPGAVMRDVVGVPDDYRGCDNNHRNLLLNHYSPPWTEGYDQSGQVGDPAGVILSSVSALSTLDAAGATALNLLNVGGGGWMTLTGAVPVVGVAIGVASGVYTLVKLFDKPEQPNLIIRPAKDVDQLLNANGYLWRNYDGDCTNQGLGQGAAFSGTDYDYGTPDRYTISGDAFSGRLYLNPYVSGDVAESIDFHFVKAKGFQDLAKDDIRTCETDVGSVSACPDAVSVKGYLNINSGADTLDNFAVVGEDGTKYLYSEPVMEIIKLADRDYASRSLSTLYATDSDDTCFFPIHQYTIKQELKDNYITAWGLKEIQDVNSVNKVTFDYRNDLLSGGSAYYTSNTPHLDDLRTCVNTPSGKKVLLQNTYLTPKFVSRINTDTHYALFEYNVISTEGSTTRLDSSDGVNGGGVRYPKLDRITLYSKDNRLISSVEFEYDYSLKLGFPGTSTGKGVLTLKRIKFKDKDGNEYMLPIEFTYSPLNPSFANLNDYYKYDSWSYYSSVGTSTSHGSDAVQNGVSAWALKKVKWNTGGTTEWTYVSDKYDYVNDNDISDTYGGGLRIDEVKTCPVDGATEGCIITKYLYSMSGLDFSGVGRISGVATAEPGTYALLQNSPQVDQAGVVSYVGYQKVTEVVGYNPNGVSDAQKAPYGHTIHYFTTAKNVGYQNEGKYTPPTIHRPKVEGNDNLPGLYYGMSNTFVRTRDNTAYFDNGAYFDRPVDLFVTDVPNVWIGPKGHTLKVSHVNRESYPQGIRELKLISFQSCPIDIYIPGYDENEWGELGCANVIFDSDDFDHYMREVIGGGDLYGNDECDGDAEEKCTGFYIYDLNDQYNGKWDEGKDKAECLTTKSFGSGPKIYVNDEACLFYQFGKSGVNLFSPVFYSLDGIVEDRPLLREVPKDNSIQCVDVDNDLICDLLELPPAVSAAYDYDNDFSRGLEYMTEIYDSSGILVGSTNTAFENKNILSKDVAEESTPLTVWNRIKESTSQQDGVTMTTTYSYVDEKDKDGNAVTSDVYYNSLPRETSVLHTDGITDITTRTTYAYEQYRSSGLLAEHMLTSVFKQQILENNVLKSQTETEWDNGNDIVIGGTDNHWYPQSTVVGTSDTSGGTRIDYIKYDKFGHLLWSRICPDGIDDQSNYYLDFGCRSGSAGQDSYAFYCDDTQTCGKGKDDGGLTCNSYSANNYDFAYPTCSENELGQQVTSSYGAIGNILSITDKQVINNPDDDLTSTFNYDNAWRLKETRLPGDGNDWTSKAVYCIGGKDGGSGSCSGTNNYVLSQASMKSILGNNVFEAVNWYDGLGRTVTTKIQGTEGSPYYGDNILTTTEYNSLGLVERSSAPYYLRDRNNEVKKVWSSPEYENSPLLRVKKIIPDTSNPSVTLETKYASTISCGSTMRRTMLKDERGRWAYTDTDNFGRVCKIIENCNNGDGTCGVANSPQTYYSYDALGNLIAIGDSVSGNGLDGVTIPETFPPNYDVDIYNEYDGLNRLIKTKHPDTGTSEITYDDNSNILTSKHVESGEFTQFYYDSLNRLLCVDYEANSRSGCQNVEVKYHYDSYDGVPLPINDNFDNFPVGKLIWVDDEVGVTVFGYDERGRIREKAWKLGTDPHYDIYYEYDKSDHVVEEKLYRFGFNGVLQQTNYIYNRMGYLVQTDVKRPDANGQLSTKATKYDYDKSSLEYNAPGTLKSIDFSNLPSSEDTKYTYDRRGWVNSIFTDVNGVNDYYRNYDFDTLGNIELTKGGTTEGSTTPLVDYSYDVLNRLTQAIGQNSFTDMGTQTYTYDNLGNRQTLSVTAQPTVNYNYAYELGGAGNQLMTDAYRLYRYDTRGNMIARIDREITVVFDGGFENSNKFWTEKEDGNFVSNSGIGATVAYETLRYDLPSLEQSITLDKTKRYEISAELKGSNAAGGDQGVVSVACNEELVAVSGGIVLSSLNKQAEKWITTLPNGAYSRGSGVFKFKNPVGTATCKVYLYGRGINPNTVTFDNIQVSPTSGSRFVSEVFFFNSLNQLTKSIIQVGGSEGYEINEVTYLYDYSGRRVEKRLDQRASDGNSIDYTKYVYGLGSSTLLEEVSPRGGGIKPIVRDVVEGEDQRLGATKEPLSGDITQEGSPLVDLQAKPTKGRVPLEVNFLVRAGDDGEIVDVSFDYGDDLQQSPITGYSILDTIFEKLGIQESPSEFTESYRSKYKYTLPGTYTATVSVKDDEGLSSTDSVTIEVRE